MPVKAISGVTCPAFEERNRCRAAGDFHGLSARRPIMPQPDDHQGELRPATRALKLVKASEQLAAPNTAPVVGTGTPSIHVRDRNEACSTLSDGEKSVSSHRCGPARKGCIASPYHKSERLRVSSRSLDPFSFFQAALCLPASAYFI